MTVVTIVCGGVGAVAAVGLGGRGSLDLLAALSGVGIVGLGDSAACVTGLSTGADTADATVGLDDSAAGIGVSAGVASNDELNLLVGVAAFLLLATLTVLLVAAVAAFFAAASAPDFLVDVLDFALFETSEAGSVLASVFVVSTVAEGVEVSGAVSLGIAETLTASSTTGVMESFDGGRVFFAIFETCPHGGKRKETTCFERYH